MSFNETITDYSSATQTLKIPFVPPGTTRACETAAWVFGSLDDTTRTPLICVHGGPGNPSVYLLQLVRLHLDCGIPVVLYDQIGCGASTHLPDTRGDEAFWGMELLVAELGNLIRFFGFGEREGRYDLLGHSCGGMIVGSFALTQPKGLRKLVLYSTMSSMQGRVDASCEQRAEMQEDVRKVLEDGDPASAEYRAAKEVFDRKHFCRLDSWPQTLLDSGAAAEEDDTACWSLYQGTLFGITGGAFREWDVRDRIGEVTEATVPGGILVVNGKWDACPEGCGREWVERPRARVRKHIFGGSGHVAHFEEAGEFLEVVGVFLGGFVG